MDPLHTNRYKNVYTTALLAGGLTLAACADTTSSTTDALASAERTSQLALTSDILADTDVGSIKFTADRVVCETDGQQLADPVETYEAGPKELEEHMFPSQIAAFEDKPYSGDSEHLFVDHYFTLPAGCYNVLIEPMQGDLTSPSEDCHSADKKDVEVKDGQTTEILLVSQCDNEGRGGLDTIATINHAPQINDLTFSPSKFLDACEDNRVCLTATDPDQDPLRIQWSGLESGTYQGSIQPVSSEYDDETHTWTFCAEVATGPAGDYQFEAHVEDLDGNGQTISEILADHGSSEISEDRLTFPMYSNEACRGRTATVLMALENIPGADKTTHGEPFIEQLADWVDPRGNADPTVLYVLDDNNNNENHGGDPDFVPDTLDAHFSDFSKMDEPSGGLTSGDLQGVDILWFSNPGFPMNDPASYDALETFLESGGGLVLQGDDMANSALLDPGQELSYFSKLRYIDNGTRVCSEKVDNNTGNTYMVTFGSDSISALDGLRGDFFEYGNDIDETAQLNEGEIVLATATYTQNGEVCDERPAAVAVDPIDL